MLIFLLLLLLVHVLGYRSSFQSSSLRMSSPTVSPEVLANIPSVWKSFSMQRLQFLDKLEMAESVTYPRYKTLIIETAGPSKYIAVCLKQTDRLCHKKLFSLGECSGGKFRTQTSSGFKFAPQEIAENITGFLSGSIPPIGFISENIPTYLDLKATTEEKIIVGSGHPGISVCVSPVDLLENSKAYIEIADIAVESVIGHVEANDDSSGDIKNSGFSEKQVIDKSGNGVKFASIPLIDANTERMHLVGVIARKRSMSKKLVFLTIVPPEFAHNSNCMERLVLGDTKAWRSTLPDTNSGRMEVQLILGATLMATVGSAGAQEMMKHMRVGQKLYITGVPKRNPNSNDVLDVVTHSVRVLEEVEIVRPKVIPKEWNLLQGSGTSNEASFGRGSSSKKRMGVKKLESRYDVTISHFDKKSTTTQEKEYLDIDTKVTEEENSMKSICYYTIDVHDDCVLYVDDLASLSKMHQTVFFSVKDGSDNKNEINMVALDCEWRPEGYYKDEYYCENNVDRKSSVMRQWSNPAYAVRTGRSAESKKKQASSPVSVLQIATRTHVFVIDLLQICRSAGAGMLVGSALTPTEAAFNEFMGRLFDSEDVIKFGMGISQDFKRLSWSYLHIPSLRSMCAVVDVVTLAKFAYPDVSKRDMEGLSKLSLRQLGLAVSKTEQISDWGTRPLSHSQIQYAAIDALVQIRIVDSIFSHSVLAVKDVPSAVSSLCRRFKIVYEANIDINNKVATRNTGVRKAIFNDDDDDDDDDDGDGGTSANSDTNIKMENFIPLRALKMKEYGMPKAWKIRQF